MFSKHSTSKFLKKTNQREFCLTTSDWLHVSILVFLLQIPQITDPSFWSVLVETTNNLSAALRVGTASKYLKI